MKIELDQKEQACVEFPMKVSGSVRLTRVSSDWAGE